MNRPSHNEWFRLDNMAKLYPSTRTRDWGSVYRFSVLLYEDVVPELLEQSVKAAARRFPTLFTTLHHGVFWYYLERCTEEINVSPVLENEPPCKNLDVEEGLCFRVLYYGKKIAVEFFHVLTDGYGALEFLKALTADYLSRKGYKMGALAGILSLLEDPLPREWEDSFAKYADRASTGGRTETPAWKITGEPVEEAVITQGLIPISALKALSNAQNVTITEYLSALMLMILWEQHTGSRPVKILVPVNLRQIFPSQTLRNFSSMARISLEEAPSDLAHACESVKTQMREQTTKEALLSRISPNVNTEKHWWMRAVPLPIKNITLKTAFNLYGENLMSTCFSNLGLVKLPPSMSEHIDRFDVFFGRPRKNAMSFAAIGFGDTFTLSFTRQIRESWIERALFNHFTGEGVPISIIANREV